MVVYQNNILTITYSPESDLLSAVWSSTDAYELSKVQQAIKKLVEVILSYDVKNLMIDASKAEMDFTNEEYKAIIVQLATDFQTTHLQKLARVTTTDPLREEKIYTIRQQLYFPYDFRDFKTREEALNWLISSYVPPLSK